MEGLVRYCSAEAALAEGLVGPAQVEWLDRVREDLQSYRAALTWLAERGRGSDMCRIAARLMFFWQIRGHAAEGLSWYEQALTLPLSSAADESTALLGVAVMCYTQGEHERARAAGTRTIALAATVEKGDVVANAEHLLGHVEYAVGNFDEARRRFTRSLTAFRERSISWGMGFSLSGMAEVALATGDAETAERLVDEATTVLLEVGPWFLSLGLYIRAIIAVRRDDADRAIATVRDSLTNIRALHDRFAFVYTLVPLAVAAALKGEDAWAARILGTRDAVIESSGAALIDTAANDLLRRAEEIGRARLGPDGWAAAYAAGRVTSIDALLKEIDRIVPKPSGLHHEVPPV
jgi:tetratricopeptide (TPR) repeat protein